MNKTELDTVYVAGLLHDIGKYIRKINPCSIKHQIFSQLFILKHPNICLGLDNERIAGLTANHHTDIGVIIKTNLTPEIIIDDNLIKLSNENITKYKDDSLVSIIKKADGFSASSDRASETDGDNGSSSPYAPLISVIGKLNNKRIAIKHGLDYKSYMWIGENDSQEMVASNDSDFLDNIKKSYESFINDINKVKTIEDLDNVLEKHLRTVNANTWRPNGASLGNTTTSLYDHSKTTSAIAVCIYINELNGIKCTYNNPHIDMIKIKLHSDNLTADYIAETILKKFYMEIPNIIGYTNDEAYIMIPQAITKEFLEELDIFNKKLYTDYGETLDYRVARDWKFKDCRDDFNTRFNENHSGILDVITTVTPKIQKERIFDIGTKNKEKCIAGFVITDYEDMLNRMMTENDSISKFATFLRTIDDFMREVQAYLITKSDVNIVTLEFDKCLYVTYKDNVHKFEIAILNIFNKYVCESTGLTFTYLPIEKYNDMFKDISNRLDILKSKPKKEGFEHLTYITINGKRFDIDKLHTYNHYFLDAQKLDNKSVLYKIAELYELGMKYKKDKDTTPIVALSRLNYLLSKTIDEQERKMIEVAYKFLFKRDENNMIISVNPTAYLLYEALYDAVRVENK